VADLAGGDLVEARERRDRETGASADVQPSGRSWFDRRSNFAPLAALQWSAVAVASNIS